MDSNKDTDFCIDITDEQSKSLARCLLPIIQRFFDSEEGRKEFEAWQAKQAQAKVDSKLKADMEVNDYGDH